MERDITKSPCATVWFVIQSIYSKVEVISIFLMAGAILSNILCLDTDNLRNFSTLENNKAKRGF